MYIAHAATYASENWQVKEGSEDEFVSRWAQFLRWTRDNIPGFLEATLIRDAGDPRHFVSFARWDDEASREAWGAPGFEEKFGACRELCEDFQGGPFIPVASV